MKMPEIEKTVNPWAMNIFEKAKEIIVSKKFYRLNPLNMELKPRETHKNCHEK
jgi:hypothetical protein